LHFLENLTRKYYLVPKWNFLHRLITLKLPSAHGKIRKRIHRKPLQDNVLPVQAVPSSLILYINPEFHVSDVQSSTTRPLAL
jgi:hypothetical protein